MESLLAEARASREPLPTRHALAYPRVCFALAFLHSTLLTAHLRGHLSAAMHASDFMVGDSFVCLEVSDFTFGGLRVHSCIAMHKPDFMVGSGSLSDVGRGD